MAPTSRIRAKLSIRGSPCGAVFSPDGRMLLAGGGSFVGMWDAPTGRMLWLRKSAHVNTAAFSPDGKLVATGQWKEAPSGRAWDYQILLSDAATGKVIRFLKP